MTLLREGWLLVRGQFGTAHVRPACVHCYHCLSGANLVEHSVYVDFGYDGAGRAVPALQTIVTFHRSGRSSAETPDLMLWLADPTDEETGFGTEVVLLRPSLRGPSAAFRRSARLAPDRAADP